MNAKLIAKLVISLTLFALLLPGQAHAYLDAGTGSYVFQLVVGAVLGGVFTVKMFWRNIKSFFAGVFSRK